MNVTSAYRPGREIARGGMGAVLDTQDEKFQRAVAMKVMLRGTSEEGRRRFLQEARVLGQLAHPNIVPVHDLGVDAQGRLFYTMKLVKGVTLRAVLDGLKAGDKTVLKKYPLGQLLTVFQKVCDAMAFAHARGVIHRDLKPDNIMVGEFGEVLVMDWGLAKVLPDTTTATALLAAEPAVGTTTDALPESPAPVAAAAVDELATLASGEVPPTDRDATLPSGAVRAEAASASGSQPAVLRFSAAPESLSATNISSVTMDGSVMGTPHFMAPEQARGAVNELDARSDVFALGGVLYMLLTLEKPVAGKDVKEVLANVLAGRITAPVQLRLPILPHCPGGRVPEALSAVAMKALQVDPARRYQSVAYLQADLAAYQSGFATSAEEAGVLKQLQLFILRHKLLASTAALIVVLAAGFMAKVMASERHARASEQEALKKEAAANADRQKDEASLARLRDTAPTFHEQAVALVKDHQLEPALEKIGFALDLVPEDVEFRLVQGNLLQTLLRLDEAKAAYATALRLAPTNAAAKVNLVFCDQLAAQVRRGEWRGNTLTNLLATLRQQERFDEAQYLDSYLGAEQRQLVETWTARLNQLKISTSYLRVNEGLTFGLTPSSPTQAQLEGLKGMPLRTLSFGGVQDIRNLAPLAGMPLERLHIGNANLDSIAALKGLPLVELSFEKSRVGADLRPLAGMQLVTLDLGSWQGDDLRPLAGMSLTNLVLNGCVNVKDLSPLAGMPLTNLNLTGCLTVNDLSPLARLPLAKLVLNECKQLQDLSPLAGMPFRRLELRSTAVKDLTPLKRMPLVELDLHSSSKVQSLEPLRGMKLRWLDVAYASITNLTALEGMPLEYLDAGYLKGLRDLKPLARLPLRQLYLVGTDKPDLSPLATCRDLEGVTLPRGCAGMEVLRKLPKLRVLSYGPATERSSTGWLTAEAFWKAYDAEPKK